MTATVDEDEVDPSSSLESRLPPFFLASSASLLTVVFSFSRHQNRASSSSSLSSPWRQGILLIVLLWLSVCLLQDEASLFVHAQFWFSLLSLCLKVYRSEYCYKGRRPLRCVLALVDSWWLLQLLNSCLVGCWVALFLYTFVATNHWKSQSRLVFCAVAVSFCHALYQWDRHRRKALQRGLAGLPLVTSRHNFSAPIFSSSTSSGSHNNSSSNKDPWYRWSVSQSLEWMAHTMPQHGDLLVEVLGPEQLTCRQIHALSASDLHQMMQLPLGVVLQLLERVQSLDEELPCPPDELFKLPPASHYNYQQQQQATNRLTERNSVELQESISWLDRYDAEYSQNDRLWSSTTTSPATFAIPDENDLPNRAQGILKERFGLELPEIRDSVSTSDHALPPVVPPQPNLMAVAASSSPLGKTPPPAMPNNKSVGQEQSTLKDLIPPDVLANMPPHVAAIAHSKPDLVRQILALRQNDNDGKLSPRPLSVLKEDEDDEEDDVASSGDEGERTELLRHRRRKMSPSQAYQSIWNDFNDDNS